MNTPPQFRYTPVFFLALALTAASAPAADPLCTVVVNNSGTARTAVPLRVRIEVPSSAAAATTCVLTNAQGDQLVGQLTPAGLLGGPSGSSAADTAVRELHFVVDQLPADAAAKWAVTLTADSDPSEAASGFHWQDEPGKWSELRFGQRPVLRYMYEALDNSTPERRDETYKVYHHLYDPQGERLVTKGPGGLFPHHRGLFYGFNHIRYNDHQADIWHCRQGEHQAHRQEMESSQGPVLGRHRVQIDWYGRQNDVFATEDREMTVYQVDGGLLVQFASRLTSRGATVELEGDPQHAGFQFRASQEVPDKTKDQTYYLRPDGRGRPGQFRNWPDDPQHVNLPWNALSFVLGNTRYTCCYLDHPENPKPARYSERDYGRFGSYFPYTLDPKHPLEITYRIWLQEGEMDIEQVENHWRNFVEPPTVAVVSQSSPSTSSPVEK